MNFFFHSLLFRNKWALFLDGFFKNFDNIQISYFLEWVRTLFSLISLQKTSSQITHLSLGDKEINQKLLN